MSDIRQAAAWLGEGRTVQRKAHAGKWWVDTYRPRMVQITTSSADGSTHLLDCNDLLADDWELAN